MRPLAYLISLALILAFTTTNGAVEGSEDSINRLLGMALIPIWCASVVLRMEVRRFLPFHQIAVAFVIWTFLSLFWSLDKDMTLDRSKRLLQSVGFAFMAWDLYQTEQEFRTAVLVYLAGCYVSMIGIFINFVQDNRVGEGWEARYTASRFDPNDLAAMLAIGIPLSWMLSGRYLRSGWGWVGTLFTLGYPAFATLAILLSGSRGALVAALPGYYLIFQHVRKQPRAGLIFLVGIAAFSGLVMTSLDLEKQSERFSKLFTSASEDGCTGRFEIWEAGFDIFINNPLLGVGGGAFPAAAGGYGIETQTSGLVAHNTYISVICELGLVGFTLFMAVIIAVYRDARRVLGPRRDGLLATLFVWAIAVVALSWECRSQSWTVFLFILCGCHVTETRPRRSLSNYRIDPNREAVP